MPSEKRVRAIILSVCVTVGILGILILTLWVSGVFNRSKETVPDLVESNYVPCTGLQTFTEIVTLVKTAADFRFGHGVAVDNNAKSVVVVDWGPPPSSPNFPVVSWYRRDQDDLGYLLFGVSSWSWSLTPNVNVPYPPQVSSDGHAVLLGVTEVAPATELELKLLQYTLTDSTLRVTQNIRISETLGAYAFFPSTQDFAVATLDGANDGTVHVYHQKLSNHWVESETLQAPGTSNTGFGTSLWTSLHCMMVLRSDGGVNPEIVEYQRSSGSHNWLYRNTLARPAGSEPVTFGQAGAISRDSLLLCIGNPGKSAGSGSVYVYRRTSLSQPFTLLQELTHPTSPAPHGFGTTINFYLSHTLLITGAIDAAQGRVYMYHLDSDGLITMQQILEQPQDPAQSTLWGFGMNYSVMQKQDASTVRLLLPRTDSVNGGSVFVYETGCGL